MPRIKGSKNHGSQSIDEKIIAGYNLNKSDCVMANELNMTEAAVQKRRYKLGLKRNKRGKNLNISSLTIYNSNTTLIKDDNI